MPVFPVELCVKGNFSFCAFSEGLVLEVLEASIAGAFGGSQFANASFTSGSRRHEGQGAIIAAIRS